MRVTIVTKPLAGTAFDATRKQIDWHDSSDRKWLMNHMHHCMMNGKIVELYPSVGDSNHAD